MSIQYYFAKTDDEKFQLMEFVYNNTDSFILNTFGYLWESRDWWDKFPIQVYKIGDVIKNNNKLKSNLTKQLFWKVKSLSLKPQLRL